MSPPTPVEASVGDAPEPELPESTEETDAEVTGAIVVVVAGTVVVVDVVVEEEVVVVVVDVVGSALGVTVQQELKVCGVPGAAALTPAVLAAVEYSQSA